VSADSVKRRPRFLKIVKEHARNPTMQFHNLRQTAFLAPKPVQPLISLLSKALACSNVAE